MFLLQIPGTCVQNDTPDHAVVSALNQKCAPPRPSARMRSPLICRARLCVSVRARAHAHMPALVLAIAVGTAVLQERPKPNSMQCRYQQLCKDKVGNDRFMARGMNTVNPVSLSAANSLCPPHPTSPHLTPPHPTPPHPTPPHPIPSGRRAATSRPDGPQSRWCGVRAYRRGGCAQATKTKEIQAVPPVVASTGVQASGCGPVPAASRAGAHCPHRHRRRPAPHTSAAITARLLCGGTV